MRHLVFLFTFSLFLISCKQKDTKQEGSTIIEKELDSTEQQISIDTFTKKDTATNIPTIEQMVLDIRNEFKRINSLRLTQKEYKFFCDADNTITYYTDNGKVIKITIAWGFVGDGSSTSEYYYKDDKLIFTYETHTGGPANGPDTKNEFRTYVNNDKTIQHIKNQKVIDCATCQFNKSSREYKALRAYNTGNITTALCK
ncbi:MAG: hypothetical protein V4556_02750 [Bacteroidota bacterium]